jgi:hypothetical protein
VGRRVDSRMVPDEVRTLPCPEQAQYAAAKRARSMPKMIMARSEGSQFIAIQHNATNLDAQTTGLWNQTRWSKASRELR